MGAQGLCCCAHARSLFILRSKSNGLTSLEKMAEQKVEGKPMFCRPQRMVKNDDDMKKWPDSQVGLEQQCGHATAAIVWHGCGRTLNNAHLKI